MGQSGVTILGATLIVVCQMPAFGMDRRSCRVVDFNPVRRVAVFLRQTVEVGSKERGTHCLNMAGAESGGGGRKGRDEIKGREVIGWREC